MLIVCTANIVWYSVAEKDVFGRKMPLSGQRGILSCFAAHPSNPTLVAAGAFNGDGENFREKIIGQSILFGK